MCSGHIPCRMVHRHPQYEQTDQKSDTVSFSFIVVPYTKGEAPLEHRTHGHCDKLWARQDITHPVPSLMHDSQCLLDDEPIKVKKLLGNT